MSQIPGYLRDFALRVAELQEQARSLGLFLEDRELLECPKCGLLEDVTIGGILITYMPSAEEKDTGLRFEETSPGRVRRWKEAPWGRCLAPPRPSPYHGMRVCPPARVVPRLPSADWP